jgi:outer membrane scaffolding protein for murein synthesis (MipA/OmpV family)
MLMHFSRILSCLLAGLVFSSGVRAETKPLWELGAGVGAINFPIYRGADERRSYILPVPYVVYRGDTLQVDREGARGLLFHNEKMELDISLNGSVPAKSRDTVARRGMPDLLPTLEIGPSLNRHLYMADDKKINLDLRLPVRTVIAGDFSHTQQAGWVFHPQLNCDVKDVSQSGWNLGLVAGALFGDSRYHRYFYDVAPQFATASRPAYTATSGYSGTQFIVALSRRNKDYWTGGFVKWDDLSGAAFVDSPLVKKRQYFTVGYSISWILDKSDKNVEVVEN